MGYFKGRQLLVFLAFFLFCVDIFLVTIVGSVFNSLQKVKEEGGIERQSVDIMIVLSVSLYSGLIPPCLQVLD